MAKITQKHNECIGCGACTSVCSNFWDMGNDGKAFLKNGKQTPSGDFELELDEKDVACNKDAVEVCPIQIISLN